MEYAGEMKFGELQAAKLLRKAKRDLAKLGGNVVPGASGMMLPPMSCGSISSINGDVFDSPSTVPSLHTSRVESEVISSSNTLRNILKRKNQAKGLTTSSVKQFAEKQNDEIDRFVMPPPSHCLLNRRKKGISETAKKATTSSPFVNVASTNSVQSTAFTETDKEYEDTESLQFTDFQTRKTTVFYRWKVWLNSQGQLIIKGTLECGKLARSKPVLRRLTDRVVESVYKHMYQLEGDLIDERNELPDYIRGKFSNGFPDDWENVHQIWRTFVSQGCKPTFRWPTRITDSDEDLKSEMTDMTFSYSRESKPEFQHSKVLEDQESVVTEIMSDDNSQSKENSLNYTCSHCSRNCKLKDSFTQTHSLDRETDLFSKILEETNGSNNSNKENQNASTSNTNIQRNENELKEMIPKEKLIAIINNLADKNSFQESINKIIYMLLSFQYIFSSTERQELDARSSKTDQSLNTLAEIFESGLTHKSSKQENTYTFSKCSYQNEQVQSHVVQNTCNKKSTKHEGTQSQSTFTNSMVTKSNCETSDQSENEMYVGVPKISIERILRSRETSGRLHNRKLRKRKLRASTSNQNGAQVQLGSSSTQTSHCKVPKTLDYDTGVSITEDEEPVKHQRFDKNDGSKSNVSGKKTQQTYLQERSNHVRNKDVSDFINKRETRDNSRNAAQDSQRSDSDDSSKQSVAKIQNANDTAHNTSKPRIVSSVPTDVHINVIKKTENFGHSHVTVTENKTTSNYSIQENIEEQSTRKVSPLKELVSNNDGSLNITPANRKQVTARSKKTKAETACEQSNNSKDLKNCSAEENSNSKLLLTNWIPRVIYNANCESKLGLIFEGKLLNKAGHVRNAKFRTQFVKRRISPTVVETVNSKLYELVGGFNDTKHVVPKELINQCRNGCPPNILQFCNDWKSLRGGEIEGQSCTATSVDALSLPVSSRGRKIVPPLCYWTGERISMKADSPMYSPGIFQESSIISCENSKKNTSDTQMQTRSKNNSKSSKDSSRKKTLDASGDTFHNNKTIDSGPNKFSSKTCTKKTSDQEQSDLHKKLSSTIRMRIAKELQFSSDSDEENQNSPVQQTVQLPQGNTEGKKDPTISKRPKIDDKQNSSVKSKAAALRCAGDTWSLKKKNEYVVTFHRNMEPTRDPLSDDISSVG